MSDIARMHNDQAALAAHRPRRFGFDSEQKELTQRVDEARKNVDALQSKVRDETHFRKALKAFTGLANHLLSERNQKKTWRKDMSHGAQDQLSVDEYKKYNQQFKNENDYMLQVHLKGQAQFYKDRALATHPAFKEAERYVSEGNYNQARQTLETYRSNLRETFHDDCASLNENGILNAKEITARLGMPPTIRQVAIDVTDITAITPLPAAAFLGLPERLRITTAAGNTDIVKQNIALTTDGSRISPDRIDFVGSERPLMPPVAGAPAARGGFTLKLTTGSSFELKKVKLDSDGIREAQALRDEFAEYQRAQVDDLKEVLTRGDRPAILQAFGKVAQQDQALVNATDHIAQLNSPDDDDHVQYIRKDIARVEVLEVREAIELPAQPGVRGEQKELNAAATKLSETFRKHAEDALGDPATRTTARTRAERFATFEHPLIEVPPLAPGQPIPHPDFHFETYAQYARAEQADQHVLLTVGPGLGGTMNDVFAPTGFFAAYGASKDAALEAAAKAYSDQVNHPTSGLTTHAAITQAIGPLLVHGVTGARMLPAHVQRLAGEMDTVFQLHNYTSHDCDEWLQHRHAGVHDFTDARNLFWKNKFAVHAIDYEISRGNYAGAADRIDALRTIDTTTGTPMHAILASPVMAAATKTLLKAEIDFENQAIQNIKNAGKIFQSGGSPQELENSTKDVINQLHKIDYDKSRVKDALSNDVRTVDQRKVDLDLMVVDRDKVFNAISELSPGLDKKIRDIQMNLDRRIKSLYQDPDAGQAGIAEMATYEATATAELAPLVIQHRIDSFLKQGRKAEADRLIEDRFKEEEKFRSDFKSFYDNEAKRQLDLMKLKISRDFAREQFRWFVFLYLAANTNKSVGDVGNSFNELSKNVIKMAAAK